MLNTRYMILLFLVIIIEGYIVLSTELLAIRQSVPFVGSGTDTVSIIIAAVLMPLALGYQAGGQFKPFRLCGQFITVRRKLILNITISALILLPGMSYAFLYKFFPFLTEIGIYNRLGQTAIYSILFLVIPVYLLGQTVPLVSNFFGKERLSKVTGKVLFLSTIGSFLGAVFSTLVLMSTIGVNHTVTFNFVLMAILVILISKKKTSFPVALTVALALGAIAYNSNGTMRSFRMVKLNEYHNISVMALKNGDRHLLLNDNYSSRYNRETGGKHSYIEFAERVALKPILNSAVPKEILVIGAGGFTFGHGDKNNHYTFVDIDEDLKNISEKYILGEELGRNREFVSMPARAFLAQTNQKYDVIYLDAYLGRASIPEHLATREFFSAVKAKMNDKGVLVTNFIASPNFADVFTRSLDNTFRSVFPHVSRHVVMENYLLWDDVASNYANIAYIYKHRENQDPGHIYTDDKNTVFYDTPK